MVGVGCGGGVFCGACYVGRGLIVRTRSIEFGGVRGTEFGGHISYLCKLSYVSTDKKLCVPR